MDELSQLHEDLKADLKRLDQWILTGHVPDEMAYRKLVAKREVLESVLEKIRTLHDSPDD